MKAEVEAKTSTLKLKPEQPAVEAIDLTQSKSDSSVNKITIPSSEKNQTDRKRQQQRKRIEEVN